MPMSMEVTFVHCSLLFFYRYMRPAVEAGYIYIAQPPLYKLKQGKNEYYIQNDKELEENVDSSFKPRI